MTSVLWGTTGTAATFAPEVGPLAIGAAALGVGGLLQAAIAARSVRRATPAIRSQTVPWVLGGLAVMVYPLAFYSSMHTAGVAIGTVVSLASAPIASGVLEVLVDRTLPDRRWVLAAALGITGGTLLCLTDAPGGDIGAASVGLGVALGLVAGTSYATYSWAVGHLMRREVPRAAAMGSVFGLGGALLVPVLLVTGAPLLTDGRTLAVGAYMALVPMFLGYVLFGYALTVVPARTATTVTLSEPAVAALLAVLVVGERLPVAGWIGLAIIGGGLVVLSLPRRRGRNTPQDQPITVVAAE
ncbi:DME family drug/metabolite transporter [Brachybacterium sacelli]|uniref:DME family drug/metabolite transporter n=1 Tax=Brachybacterium sacelli TaxID=173364 RepID=A0ABS4WWW7_9MICO|nr:DME family drug/metabolite transporter [Brachybacterium sacelli]